MTYVGLEIGFPEKEGHGRDPGQLRYKNSLAETYIKRAKGSTVVSAAYHGRHKTLIARSMVPGAGSGRTERYSAIRPSVSGPSHCIRTSDDNISKIMPSHRRNTSDNNGVNTATRYTNPSPCEVKSRRLILISITDHLVRTRRVLGTCSSSREAC